MKPCSDSTSTLRRSACLMVATVLLVTMPASAWDAEVHIDRLDDYFYVDSFTGSYIWTTVQEGVRADSGSGSIPINYTFQSWDGNEWPSDSMSDVEFVSGVWAETNLEHYDGVEDEFLDYASSYVYGDIAPGMAYGASWAYDFTLTVNPFSFANVFLDGAGASGYIESETGDDGNAFAGIKLYSHDLGLNDIGGANNPYDAASLFLSSPPEGELVEDEMGLSYQFTNAGAAPVTYHLRLQGSLSVFENVPEPASLALIGIGGLALIARRPRKSAA